MIILNKYHSHKIHILKFEMNFFIHYIFKKIIYLQLNQKYINFLF
jgi:hypothetical protein